MSDAHVWGKTSADATPDPVSPSYYQAANGVCFADIVDGFNLNHWCANIVKYVLRAHRKGQLLEDLHKAQWCLSREIARIKAELREEVRDE